jgi:predicted  nucleic acid-binding Zn-ribbon protein
LIFVLLVVPALGRPQESEPAAAAPASETSKTFDTDRFADDRKRAEEGEKRWRAANDSLKSRLAALSPCSPDRLQAIHQTQDLAFEAITLRAEYNKKWLDSQGEQARLDDKFIADLITLRRELERMASAAEESLKDLERRKAELKESAKSSGVSVEDAVSHLDELLKSARGRLETLRLSFAHVDEAERDRTTSRGIAQFLSELIEQAQSLKQAESGLWQSYYDALAARAGLDCDRTHLDPKTGWDPGSMYRP